MLSCRPTPSLLKKVKELSASFSRCLAMQTSTSVSSQNKPDVLPDKSKLLKVDWVLEKMVPLVLKSHVRNFVDICQPDVVFEDKLYNYNIKTRSSLLNHIAKVRMYYRYLSPYNKVEWTGSCVYEDEDVVVVLWKFTTLESSFMSYFPTFITKREQKMNVKEGSLDVHVDKDGMVYKIVNRQITASDREGAKAMMKIKDEQKELYQRDEEKRIRKEFDEQFHS